MRKTLKREDKSYYSQGGSCYSLREILKREDKSYYSQGRLKMAGYDVS
ncbi:hypothetical protein [Nostoc sp. NMS8]|nr:hypothetical protein [Nostoc sp. NMS8]MBN3958708.1 hypothetical protein [Nostoc sp. NMS8]